MNLLQHLARWLACRILGHRWHFLHARDSSGRVYSCRRCQRQATFIR